MNRLRVPLAAAVLLVLTASLAGAGGARADSHPGTTAERIKGNDGLLYDSAPWTVMGLDGQLFLGPDFDIACSVGSRYPLAMRTYAKVAKIIEKSGRRVIFTAGPNKSAVLSTELDPAQLPHGSCDVAGLAAQTRTIDSFRDPNYLPLRRALLRSRHQTYYRTDPHWSSVGGSVFAKAVATRLDPRLGRRQRYTYGTEQRLGMLNEDLGISVPETAETASPETKVVSTRAKGSDVWAGYPALTWEYAWNSKPARLTWPGRTLLLGDSFMMFALDSMLPLFEHGRFMWLGHSDSDVAKAIKHSDTVVIEVVQLFVPGTVIATKPLQRELRRTLLRSPRRGPAVDTVRPTSDLDPSPTL